MERPAGTMKRDPGQGVVAGSAAAAAGSRLGPGRRAAAGGRGPVSRIGHARVGQSPVGLVIVGVRLGPELVEHPLRLVLIPQLDLDRQAKSAFEPGADAADQTTIRLEGDLLAAIGGGGRFECRAIRR